MKEKVRIAWLDAAKGIGVILVVLGHCVVKTNYLHKIIFSFHMPLFFLLSGYCFDIKKYGTFREVLLKRGRALLVPYIKFALVGLVITLLISEWRQGLTLKGIVTDVYQGYPATVHVTSIWYLISLYVISLAYYIMDVISKKLGRKYVLYIEVAISGILGYMVYIVKMIAGVGDNKAATANMLLPGGRLPFTIDASMTALVFFAIGVWLNENKYMQDIKYKRICIGIGGLLAIAVGGFVNVRVNIHGCSYGNPLLFYSTALGGAMMVIAFSQLLCLRKNQMSGRAKDVLVFYGRHSLFMMGAQSIFINLYIFSLNKLLGTEYVLYEVLPVGYGILGFIAITFILLPVSYGVGVGIRRLEGKIGKNRSS